MGISDWFKRFRSNASALEQYREGADQDEADQSQATRAAHERAPVPSEGASAQDESDGGTG
jgi:hypothetical protein